MKDLKAKLGSQRTKQIEEDRKEAVKAIIANRGILKGKGKAKTEEEFKQLQEEANKQITAHYEKKFGISLR